MHLTPRQLDIVRFILQYRAREGFSPTLQEIADHLDISPVTVYEHTRALERKGALRRTPNEARSLEVVAPELLELVPFPASPVIPLVGQIAAGRPVEALEEVENINLSEMLALDRATYMLQVRGDSMIGDHIRDGDYVLIEQRGEARDGETVVALLPDGELTLKRFYREPDRIRLQPANPDMEPIYTTELQIQGIVVGILRKCTSEMSVGPVPGLPPRPSPQVGRKEANPSASDLRSYWQQSLRRARQGLRRGE